MFIFSSLVKSIGKGVLGGSLGGITFDLKGNVWVTDTSSWKVLKLSQDGQLLQAVDHVGSKSDCFNCPTGVSVSPEGLITSVIMRTTVSPFTMKKANFTLLLDQRKVAQGVLMDLVV